MRAGKLDRTIAVERVTETLDDYGNPISDWEVIAELRAQVLQASTEEFMRAFGASSEIAIVFRTRYVAGITLADRIVYEGQPYTLKETKELGRRRGLELRCIAVGA